MTKTVAKYSKRKKNPILINLLAIKKTKLS